MPGIPTAYIITPFWDKGFGDSVGNITSFPFSLSSSPLARGEQYIKTKKGWAVGKKIPSSAL